MGRVILKDEIKRFGEKARITLDFALDNIAKDIVNIAKIYVPYKEGDLFKEIMHEKVAILAHKVVVDSDYAAYQERGKRKDGTHVVRKYTTPNTGAHFLENAANKIVENAVEYIRQANQLNRF